MTDTIFEDWERESRNAAQADNYANFRSLQEHLNLEGSAEEMLKATVLLVGAAAAYAELDDEAGAEFFDRQQYNPETATGVNYVITLDLADKVYGRLLVPKNLKGVDLADLFGHPWYAYERVGYCALRVSRIDEDDLTTEELTALEATIVKDLRFDYSERELHLNFDPDTTEGSLIVWLQDFDMEIYADEWEPLPDDLPT